jgi:hypothetical protein
MKRHIGLFIALGVLCALPTDAQPPKGFLIGGSVGQSYYDTELEDVGGEHFKLNDQDFAYKLFAGYRFGFLAIEGGYRDLGKVEDKEGDIVFRTETTGLDLALLGMLPIGPVDVFARAGAIVWDSEWYAGNIGSTESDTDFMWGVGGAFRLGGLGIRLEWEQFEIDPDSIGMLSAGVTFTFG